MALKINQSYIMWNHSDISSYLTGGKGTKETEGNGMGWAGLGKKKKRTFRLWWNPFTLRDRNKSVLTKGQLSLIINID